MDRKVSFLLGLGIFLSPFIFAWFTLRKGYSKKARIIAFAWMFLSIPLIILRLEPYFEAKSQESFVNDNAKLIDEVAIDLIEIKYSSDDELYYDDIDDLHKCITTYPKLKKISENYKLDEFDLNSILIEQARHLKESIAPWNNLNESEQVRLQLKGLECDKKLGLLTNDMYEKRRNHYLKKPEVISKFEVEEEIEKLKYQGFSDKAIIRHLLTKSRFKDTLRYILVDYEINGAYDPVYLFGREFGLDYNNDVSRFNRQKFEAKINKFDKEAEDTRKRIASLDTTPNIDTSKLKSSKAPTVDIEE